MNNLIKLQCPNCKGYKILDSKKTGLTIFLFGLVTFVFIFGLFLLPFGFIMMLLPATYTCQSCGYKWRGKAQPAIKECTGQVMAKCTPKKLKAHYRFMLSASKRDMKGYIQSRVVSSKYWMAGKEKEVCDTCRENERVGVIPLDALFPSGHLYPPAGVLCRCSLGGKTNENA